MDLRQRQVARLSELLGFIATGNQVRSAFYMLSAAECGSYAPRIIPRNAEEAARYGAEDAAHDGFIRHNTKALGLWITECAWVLPNGS